MSAMPQPFQRSPVSFSSSDRPKILDEPAGLERARSTGITLDELLSKPSTSSLPRPQETPIESTSWSRKEANEQTTPPTQTEPSTALPPPTMTVVPVGNKGTNPSLGEIGKRVGLVGLDRLQRSVLSQDQKNPLSPVELRELFSQGVTPELVLYLDLALQRRYINPSTLLVQAIAQASNRDSMIPVALSLRHGANPNVYVDVPGMGTMHVLAYVYLTHMGESRRSSDAVNTLVIMLMLSGSRPVMPIFDVNAGRIREESSLFGRGKQRGLSVGSRPDLTVLEWLSEGSYDTIIPEIQVGYSGVDEEFMTRIGILLDRTDLSPGPLKDLSLAFASRSNEILRRWVDRIVAESPNDKDLAVSFLGSSNYQGARLSIDYLNTSIFQRLVEAGYLPDYNAINLILVRIRQYQSIRDRLSSQQLEEMLLEAVRYGAVLDRDQFAMIGSMPFGRIFADAILQEYNQPYWRKACRQGTNDTNQKLYGSKLQDRLRKFAISLGIDPTQEKSDVCGAIDRLSLTDPNLLRQAAIRRQQIRISANVSYPNEYIGTGAGSVTGAPMLLCRNQSMLEADKNPYEYNDVDLAFYRDGSGSVWCFTRDTFESLLETGVNPYSLQPLPESFRTVLQNQMDLARRLGLFEFSSRPARFTEAIEKLHLKDKIEDSDNDESTRAVETLIQTSTLYGIRGDKIRSLTRQQMEQLLSVIGSEPLPLEALTTSHALVTFARQIQEILRQRPESARLFFSNLASLSV